MRTLFVLGVLLLMALVAVSPAMADRGGHGAAILGEDTSITSAIPASSPADTSDIHIIRTPIGTPRMGMLTHIRMRIPMDTPIILRRALMRSLMFTRSRRLAACRIRTGTG